MMRNNNYLSPDYQNVYSSSSIPVIFDQKVSKYYSFEDAIEKGGFGTVFRAYSRETGEKVAIKRTKKCSSASSVEIDHSKEEVYISVYLNHPNIVYCTESFSNHGETFYLVMEYMSYDLHYLLWEWKIEFKMGEKRNIFSSVCRGLEYLHNKNIVHRDIKSSNILINKNGDVKIGDFGLAIDKNFNHGPYDHGVGTITYSSPEVLLGEKSYDSSVDLWGLGIILVNLFRVKLFRSGCERDTDQLYYISTSVLYSSIFQFDFVPKVITVLAPRILHRYLKDLPESAKILTDKLLQYDPRERPSAKECLESDFLTEGEITPLKDLYKRRTTRKRSRTSH
ncbi:hypothetical protein LAZ67_10000288 [Cordylochernes scorpioides]|uniref:Protein kinase domain-containing protein n=1 Tax=Cordylochernes scorpioides TaxID=51811 RepID=A0ABY6KV04_9ARAC|nr:hypothetical protein LAZ67_10000288 [Cordylochernes scorpioides]